MYDKARFIGTMIDFYHQELIHNKEFRENLEANTSKHDFNNGKRLGRLKLNYVFYILNIWDLEKSGKLLVEDVSFQAGKLSAYSDDIYPGVIRNAVSIVKSDVSTECYWDPKSGSARFKNLDLYELVQLPYFFKEVCYKWFSYSEVELFEIWKKDPNYKYVLKRLNLRSNFVKTLTIEEMIASRQYLSTLD